MKSPRQMGHSSRLSTVCGSLLAVLLVGLNDGLVVRSGLLLQRSTWKRRECFNVNLLHFKRREDVQVLILLVCVGVYIVASFLFPCTSVFSRPLPPQISLR